MTSLTAHTPTCVYADGEDCNCGRTGARRSVLIEPEPHAAGQQGEAELVEADALPLGLGRELLVQGDGEAKQELTAGFHESDGTAYGIDIDSTAGNTMPMSTMKCSKCAGPLSDEMTALLASIESLGIEPCDPLCDACDEPVIFEEAA